MKALIFEDGKLRYTTEAKPPVRKKGEALIRVTQAGICGTDMEITKGYSGFNGILGHEFVGVVEQSDDSSLVGHRVVGTINCGCGVCQECRADMQNHCKNRTVLGIDGRSGAFAELITLPEDNLTAIPDNIVDDMAVFMEPLAAAYRVVEQVKLINGKTLVLGDGKLGLLVAQVAAFVKGNVTICGRHERNLKLLEHTKITTLLENQLEEQKKYTTVVDCTGCSGGAKKALSHVKPKGSLVLKTTVAKPDCLDLNYVVINEISIIGSRCGPYEHAETLMEMNAMNLQDMIDARFPLEDGIAAFEKAAESGVLKVLLEI